MNIARALALVLGAAALVCGPFALALPSTHASNAKIAGRCFWMHGRLAYGNGTPDARIWRVGTKRMFGVFSASGEEEEEGVAPPAVERLIQSAPSDTDVFGDYDVCPLTRARPGWMQMVFIKRATHLVAVRR